MLTYVQCWRDQMILLICGCLYYRFGIGVNYYFSAPKSNKDLKKQQKRELKQEKRRIRKENLKQKKDSTKEE